LTFSIPQQAQWIRRSYSISSTPSKPYTLEVTVKKLTDGYVSNWFHEQMKVGKEVIARGPHGQFTLFEAKREKLLLMAAGVGITPMISMLRWLVDTRAPNDVVLFYRVHSLEDAIFVDELAQLEDLSKGRIRVLIMTSVTSDDWPRNLQVFGGAGIRGISPETIISISNDFQDRSIFLCGPDGFMEDIKNSLGELHFDMEYLHDESFVGLNNTPSREKLSSTETNLVTLLPTRSMADEIPDGLECEIEFRRSKKSVFCQKGDNILEVAEFYGIDIPNSCRMGACGSCKCIRISGEIVMSNTQGLSDADKLSKQVLLCVGSVNSPSIILDI
jgi:ferredoxin-NADP reductase